MYRRVFGIFLALMLAIASAPVMAQETTGAIEGNVKDSSGGFLPGVTVQVVGPSGTLVAVTDERGEYRFPRLSSGRYTVRATLDGFSPNTKTVDLTVGSTSRAEFTLAVGGVTETIEVSGATPVIDLRSAATATSISRERIEFIPRGRDFTDVVGQAAGANPEAQAGGISINGSSGSENRFIIDGIDTTDPQEGISAIPLRAEFMEEVQVKSAGYAAEFGGSTGGVINAITRSGTNNVHGMILADFQQRSWGGSERPILVDSLTSDTFEYITPPKEDETRIDPGFSLGGPILRDRLWFFGMYQPGIRDTTRTVNFQDDTVDSFDQEFRVHYGSANITGNAGSKLLFRVGGNFSPFETKGSLPVQTGRTTLTSPDDYLRGTEGTRSTFSGSLDWVPTAALAVSGRAGRFLTDSQSTNVEFPELIHNFSTASTPAGIAALPAEFRQPAGFTSNVLIVDATARDEYVRDYIGADATYFLNAGGQHQIKGGFQTERISNDVQSGYNADRILYYAGRPYTTAAGESVQGQFGYFRLLNISTLGEVASRNNALFIQDTWTLRPNLTLNIGLRAEQENVPNFGEGQDTAIEFGWGQKVAPRLGFTYDPFSDGRTKIYGSWGKYFDVMKYEMPRGSFGGDKWVDYFYTWDSPNYQLNASGCVTGANIPSVRPTCGAGTFIEALDRRHNSAANGGEGIEPDLKPMQETEFQIGVSRELTNWNNVVVGARYIRKDLVRTIEDVGVLQCEEGSCAEVFYIANPGEGISLSLFDAPGVPGFPKAERQYDGLELTLERRFANNWAAFASYTLSRLYGNYSGLASSDEDGRTSPNVNRFFDHIENTFDRSGNPVLGRLGTDRPHQFKAQVIYQTNFNMTLGVNQRVQSGIPISEEGNVGATVPFFPFGRNNLGRTPVLSQTDLSLNQSVRLAGTEFQVGVTVLNLFDQDTVTRRYNNRMVGNLPLTTQEFFAGGWDYQALLAADPTLLDVKFNQADQYQAPREVRFTVKFTF